jgi:hypothetical protein
MSALQNRNASPMHADRCCAVPCAEAGVTTQIAASIKMPPMTVVDLTFLLMLRSCDLGWTAGWRNAPSKTTADDETQIASRYAAIAVAYRSNDTAPSQAEMRVIVITYTRISKSYLYGELQEPISHLPDRRPSQMSTMAENF